ncbi:MAG: ATP-binding cassette domain-containing protein [Alsobacter sp.]
MSAVATRALLAPEVVQTSSMDCGPAVLKCLLEGFGIQTSYSRLREACQTSVDGTSVDSLEQVAGLLGLQAEQMVLAADVLLEPAFNLPAILVSRLPDGATHFVVVWRHVGSWLQVMDPAVGRRWVRGRKFLREAYRHALSVSAVDWRDFAASEDFQGLLRSRMARLGADPGLSAATLGRALMDPGWFSLATLDAALRLAETVAGAGGILRADGVRLALALFDHTLAHPGDIHAVIGEEHWTVVPNPGQSQPGAPSLKLRGAVLVRILGKRECSAGKLAAFQDLPDDLKGVFQAPTPSPLRTLWRILQKDGATAPLALAGAIAAAALFLVLEALLFRGLFDAGAALDLGWQRAGGLAALVVFMIALLALRLPISTESLRLGRRLEARMRLALLARIPHLTDRYVRSLPVSDMVERAHAIQAIRAIPTLAVQFVQSGFELVLTVAGLALIDAGSLPATLLLVAISLGLPALVQAGVAEADMRVRSHAAALGSVQLDALLGIVPIRVHGAQKALQRLHESLLVSWTRGQRTLARLSVLTGSLQQGVATMLVGWLVLSHLARSGALTGTDLLFTYWALKLPVTGRSLALLAPAYPVQRNVLLRLLEPLNAPTTRETPALPRARWGARPVALGLEEATVLAGGHELLRDVSFTVNPGEHVAVVGPSGAGKSTLVGLLLGWHGLARGRLVLDGAEASPADLQALRRSIAWVDPSVQIWDASLIDNVAFASPDARPEHLSRSMEASELRPLLERLPSGLQSMLGEGGAKLSGGEGQRLRLARALAQPDPALVLLDEPFRGMDRDQRRRLLGQTREHWRATTLLCVTHDLVETLAFDRVLVVEDGRIVEDGDPAQLASGESRYRALLKAESHALDVLWDNPAWLRFVVEHGHVRRKA